MNIVFLNPEIPTNTGNIGRTCVLTNTKLHLIKPLGFSLEDKYIKKGGLDYWEKVQLFIWEDFDHFYKENIENKDANLYFATTKTNQKYSDVKFQKNDFIMFGPESRGIPEEILNKYKEYNITIPMIPMGRSINLANSASIILYEALRQNDFDFSL
ncbi:MULTISPECIES: tRNA (cytidine(34)-2'-O)-methyltransferase [unclassified Leptotrichia]|jgi:putative tRNA/rRNA methyltransferase|uniref:tRNA (cytidine(34)-2'-O)-methyltransferase n=1 Tax=unclassified Leptotrichia TaxID=2633022 RepID=UPI0017E66CA1|nr:MULTISPECIES: tRNA (cytidine(34)-2'-O)-methyltransferase [unclassified Leptotrichia]MBB1535173.1 tRNA (cytidine(34)-2'-O)-methyltransferase [Leptotrichia sp.]QUB96560.1 tRNA (cytidine(34)-2'-O)-methyltransferase [Leptotrichia sp. oral taxon 221]